MDGILCTNHAEIVRACIQCMFLIAKLIFEFIPCRRNSSVKAKDVCNKNKRQFHEHSYPVIDNTV